MLFGIEVLADGDDSKRKLNVAGTDPLMTLILVSPPAGDDPGSILGPAPQVRMTRKPRGTYQYLLAGDGVGIP
jgi:hypothetical protein